MKLTITLIAYVFITTNTFSQFNYLINSSSKESTYIRDAMILKDGSLLCALDLETKDTTEAAFAKMNSDGSTEWSKEIIVPGSEDVFSYDILNHENGFIYLHGLAIVAFEQYAFVLKISRNGNIENSTFFKLGSSTFQAINKMKKTKNGDLILSFSHYEGVSFVRMNPNGDVKWGTTIDRNIKGTGKQAGYDFQILEDEGIVACGKNNFHFGIIKLSSKGEIIWDQDISMGQYSQAKTIQVLPDGDLFITGDYLPEPGFTSFIMKVDGKYGSPIWAKQIDQFDGSFHYQQTELIGNEIHLSMMGNNDPQKMNPDFQNYYVRLNFDGEVLGAYRNGDLYDLADYQRLIRLDEGGIIYGSAYNENREISGMIHSYKSHDFDMCYWTELELTTSAVSENAERSLGAYGVDILRVSDGLDLKLKNLKLESQGTCKQVWNESTQKETENAERDELIEENAIIENKEFVVFPNPNDGIFNIRTNYDYVNATVLDISGKVIFEGRLHNDSTIDLSQHPHGMYIMRIVTESETFIRRVQIR